MTIPPYTSTSKPVGVGSATLSAQKGEAPATGRILDRWLERVAGRPRRVQLALDVAMALVTLLIVAQVAPPEVLFHVIFVALVMHAFLFGLADTLWRIGIVSVALLGYEAAPGLGVPFQSMDLTEWPLMFVIAVLVAWMADRRATTARLYASLFRGASDRLLAVQEDERRRFARELHDGVGQTLTALTLTLDAAAAGRGRGEADARLASARRLAEDALLETHDLAERLRPARLEQIGLAAAVRDLGGRVGLPVRVEIGSRAAQTGLLDPGAAAEVYRIVQEALSNAARHSGAPLARVVLAAKDGVLRVVVDDKGHGFDPANVRETGLGLAGMRERAALLGARLRVESAPGRGTRVALEVPLTRSSGDGA